MQRKSFRSANNITAICLHKLRESIDGDYFVSVGSYKFALWERRICWHLCVSWALVALGTGSVHEHGHWALWHLCMSIACFNSEIAELRVYS